MTVSDGQLSDTKTVTVNVTDVNETSQPVLNIINGDENDNTISGTDEGEIINGLAGNDTINGNDGKDEIHGNSGDDLLYGGTGDDVLDGGPGNDQMNGGEGSDNYIYFYDGSDTIIDTGAFGEDTLNLKAYLEDGTQIWGETFFDENQILVFTGHPENSPGSYLLTEGIEKVDWVTDDGRFENYSVTLFNNEIHSLNDNQQFWFVGTKLNDIIHTNVTGYAEIDSSDGDDTYIYLQQMSRGLMVETVMTKFTVVKVMMKSMVIMVLLVQK